MGADLVVVAAAPAGGDQRVPDGAGVVLPGLRAASTGAADQWFLGTGWFFGTRRFFGTTVLLSHDQLPKNHRLPKDGAGS